MQMIFEWSFRLIVSVEYVVDYEWRLATEQHAIRPEQSLMFRWLPNSEKLNIVLKSSHDLQ